MSRPTYVGDCTECDRPMYATNRGSTRGLLRHAGHGLCQRCYKARRRLQQEIPDLPIDPEDELAGWFAMPDPGLWTKDARCAETDPDIFHPEVGQNVDAAKKICDECPVKAQCLAFALRHPRLTGVWGGTTPKERARIRAAQERIKEEAS